MCIPQSGKNCVGTAVAIVLAIACASLATPRAETSPCPEYNKPVILTGTISVQTVRNRDILPPVERYLLLKLDDHLCTMDSADEPGEFGQWAVHVVYSPPDENLTNEQILARRPPWMGQHVSVSGKLFHANTVHHKTPVLIDASKIRVVGR
jgi:hypothetical protein